MDINGYIQNLGNKINDMVGLIDDLPKYSTELKSEYGVAFPAMLRDLSSRLMAVYDTIFEDDLMESEMDTEPYREAILAALRDGIPKDTAAIYRTVNKTIDPINAAALNDKLTELLDSGEIRVVEMTGNHTVYTI